MQIATTKPAPVRPYQRFPATKVVNTGKSPMGAFLHFVSKDPFQNLDWKRDHHNSTVREMSVKIPKGKCPFGTTVHTFKLGMDENAKLNRKAMSITTRTFPRNPTDNLSAEPPANSRPF